MALIENFYMETASNVRSTCGRCSRNVPQTRGSLFHGNGKFDFQERWSTEPKITTYCRLWGKRSSMVDLAESKLQRTFTRIMVAYLRPCPMNILSIHVYV